MPAFFEKIGLGGVSTGRTRVFLAIFFLVVTLFAVWPEFSKSFSSANQFRDVTRSDWSATNIWIASAACAKETGAFLAFCGADGLQAINDVSSGDDPGHALILGLYAKIFQKVPTYAGVSELNTMVNLTGIIALGATIFALRLPLTGIIFLYFAAPSFFRWLNLAPHPAQMGALALAMVLPIAILGRVTGVMGRRSAAAFIGIGLAGLAVAALFRQSIGMMGLLASLAAAGVGAVIDRRSGPRELLKTGCLVLSILVASQATQLVTKARDALYPILASKGVQSHGAFHSIFIGLGAVENKFGVAWDDSIGYKTALSIDPNVRFMSARYLDLLRQEYIRLALSDPLEVIRIYAVKLKVALGETNQYGRPFLPKVAVWSGLLASLVIWMIAARGGWYRRHFPALHVVFGVSFIFICFLLAQAAIIHPSFGYLAPIFVILSVLGSAAVEIGLRRFLKLTMFIRSGRLGILLGIRFSLEGWNSTQVPTNDSVRETSRGSF